jgi:hypothetical protein
MTPTAIEPATFLLVAQCLNELRYRVPLLDSMQYLISHTIAPTGLLNPSPTPHVPNFPGISASVPSSSASQSYAL